MNKYFRIIFLLIISTMMLFSSFYVNAAGDKDSSGKQNSTVSQPEKSESNAAVTNPIPTEEIGGNKTYSNDSTYFSIDNKNKYSGMKNSYSDGYIPTISNNTAKVVVPLISSAEIKDNCITAKAQMDFSEMSPFICKNYEKQISSINNNWVFLVTFDLELSDERKNGNYPVNISVNAFDTNNTAVNFETVVYVAISDGKSDDVDKNIKMQFDELNIPTEVTVSDQIDAGIKAINLSKCKVYNVRATLKADGLICKTTAFIGDMEPSSSVDSSFSITVTSLSGDMLYGKTNGIVTFFYEDENGTEFTEEKPFYTTIKSPFSENPEQKKDNPNQWWIIMLIVVIILISIISVYVVLFLKKRSKK